MNFLKRLYFDVVSFFIMLVVKGTGWIHAPWTHKKTCQDDIEAIKEVLIPGDIILTHTEGEFTTLTIPGFWKHCEIYVDYRKTVGAVSPKARMAWLEDVIHGTDYFCVIRMKGVTEKEGGIIAEHAYDNIGKFYDIRMNFKKGDKISCSELVFNAINESRPNYLELRNRLGFMTVTPQDLHDAKSKFEIIYEKLD